jgi:hypothetical protein
MMVSLACDRELTPDDFKILGPFRQLYQQLRESIRDDVPLRWDSSTDKDYVSFKTLAPKVASLVSGKSDQKLSDEYSPSDALKEITANKWEYT